MTLKNLYLLLLVAFIASVAAQSDDELHIPVENDNQFPPDKHSELDGSIVEGSGGGAIEDPIDKTTVPTVPLEDVQLTAINDKELPAVTSQESTCPKPCVCNVEGELNNYVVDCSGYDLTTFPLPLDSKTTTLNVQNNKLTEIPKEVSALKSLKILNANNNSLMDLASGSISELPELTVLKLGNNRLIEYPKDLKNGFGLTKLEELDLGGNDMRTPLTSDTFTNFKALRKLTLPTSTSVVVEDLCGSLKESLEIVCTDSCSAHSFECPEAPLSIEDGLFDAILPGTIALHSILDDMDPVVKTEDKGTNPDNQDKNSIKPQSKTAGETTEAPADPNDSIKQTGEVSLRSAVNKAPEGIAQMNSLVETSKETTSSTVSDVAVGATTSSTKTGGVDKSIIGIIVAGMVLVVAGITIKKNWSSIRNRFSSSPITPNERTGANANGTTPEEVPLQEKSPV